MHGEHVQTKHEIQAILESLDLRPMKRFGQNFLIDGNLMRKLVDAGDVTDRDFVLEVGGGTGGLSDLLAVRAGRLVIVEVVAQLAEFLTDRFADRDNVTVISDDVLANKSHLSPKLIEALAAAPTDGGRWMLVANLPYQVATPLIMNLLTCGSRFERFCFSIQQEMADRLLSPVGVKDYGPVSIAVQTVCEIKRVARLPAEAFWPAPKICSAIVRMDRKAHPFEHGDALARYIELLHAAFSHRRKTLRYNLSRLLDESVLASASLDLSMRAQQVDVQSWIKFGQTVLLKPLR